LGQVLHYNLKDTFTGRIYDAFVVEHLQNSWGIFTKSEVGCIANVIFNQYICTKQLVPEVPEAQLDEMTDMVMLLSFHEHQCSTGIETDERDED
jgi:hypothetical protein